MKSNMKKNTSSTASVSRGKAYKIIILLCSLMLLASVGGVLAKYIITEGASGEITPALFYTDGDYVEKISDEGTAPQIHASGWSEGIVLKLYNYEGDKVSEVDLTYSVELPEGWDYSPKGQALTAGTKSEVTLTLIPPADAKRNDTVDFKLVTAPYSVTMKATFVLSDSNKPEWTVTDMGAYTLLKVYTNDYAGEISVNYDKSVFAPDTTNELMSGWLRADGAGSFTAERFSTYELMLFEELPADYSFVNSSGEGNSVSVEIAP